MRATDPAGSVERWPTYDSVNTALPGGMTPELPRQMPPPRRPSKEARDPMMESVKTIEPEWVVLNPNQPGSGSGSGSGSPSIPVAAAAGITAQIVTAQEAKAETEPLMPAAPGAATRARWRMIVTWVTAVSMVITLAVLLVSVPRRGHHPSVETPYIRPGEGCHNMWVWLASLLLLDAVHLLLHQLERVVKREDWYSDSEDQFLQLLFDEAIQVADGVVLAARVLTSWYGVGLVIGIAGFLIVVLMVCLCAGVVGAATVFATSATNNQQAGMSVGAVVLLAFTALAFTIIVDQTSGYPCHDLLHFWAMTLASVYAITLFLALVFLIIAARESKLVKQLMRKPARMTSTGSIGSNIYG